MASTPCHRIFINLISQNRHRTQLKRLMMTLSCSRRRRSRSCICMMISLRRISIPCSMIFHQLLMLSRPVPIKIRDIPIFWIRREQPMPILMLSMVCLPKRAMKIHISWVMEMELEKLKQNFLGSSSWTISAICEPWYLLRKRTW